MCVVEVRGLSPKFAEALGLVGAPYTGLGWGFLYPEDGVIICESQAGFQPKPLDEMGKLLYHSAANMGSFLRVQINAFVSDEPPPDTDDPTPFGGREHALELAQFLYQQGYGRTVIRAFSTSGCLVVIIQHGRVLAVEFPPQDGGSYGVPDAEHVVFHDSFWDDEDNS